MSRSAEPKPVPIAGGKPCPKCGKAMQRYEHSADWRPKRGRNFYRFWDRCGPCSRVQHYSKAKVIVLES